MKILLISVTTLILIFALIICNFFFINNIYEHMTRTVTNLNINSETEINDLLEFWEKKRVLISMSIPHRISDELEKCLVILRTKILYKSDIEFEEARCSLLNAINEMKIHAEISIDTIF